jgi:hypothetical protein
MSDEYLNEEFGKEYIEELVTNGFLILDKNEFDETIYSAGPGLEDECPILYEAMMGSAKYLIDILMESDLISAYYNDFGDEIYYATQRGEEFFMDMIVARKLRISRDELF